ncbi:hypothetical protein JAAARDRAFT_74847 [Jaapia argillacea MUCL 33604]|uniref:Uncharacterized protein n=1 Tax=Jaapia argillacea MUCL 33604 TaxID=933084 RepID=A0A067QMX6_9AGAM|nr:hypothetical protein JAAARDRAFT_74847 [Jaapia argillacea MUCL 33604]
MATGPMDDDKCPPPPYTLGNFDIGSDDPDVSGSGSKKQPDVSDSHQLDASGSKEPDASGSKQSESESSFKTRTTYAFPTTFKIGSKLTSHPLVQPHHLKLHLRLLRAFAQLKTVVEERGDLFPKYNKEIVPVLTKPQKWGMFIHMAVDRFERWLKTLTTTNIQSGTIQEWIDKNVPPLDVLMVWHTYLLNPGQVGSSPPDTPWWYMEDRQRIKIVAALPMYANPLLVVAHLGDVFSFKPHPAREFSWKDKTGLPFDHQECATALEHGSFQCPRCNKPYIQSYIYIDKGWTQRGYRLNCIKCGLFITRDTLAVDKFARDLARDHNNLVEVQAHGNGVYLAGTLRTPTQFADITRARILKDSIIKRSKVFKNLGLEKGGMLETRKKLILEAVQYRKDLAMQAVEDGLGLAAGDLSNRIMSAYSDNRPFSVELVGAVLRQSYFVAKMQDLGWTGPAYFASQEDAVVLQHAVVRYHAFLDLISHSPKTCFVPTLDIDLVWHTHQLLVGEYWKDCMEGVGRFVDHDDKVEEHKLSNAFDNTCLAWKSRFNVAYAHCGCPIPGDTIGQKLSHLRSSSGFAENILLPPMDDTSACSASHPSDHNAIYSSATSADRNLSESYRGERYEKAMKRRERDAENVKSGKMDQQTFERGEGHAQAFLIPVPMYSLGGTGGCVATDGNTITIGTCAAGAGGCVVGASLCGAGDQILTVKTIFGSEREVTVEI